MRIFILDNYDSFTFNLVHYLEPICTEIKVKQHDEAQIEEMKGFDAILLSPGPGLPNEAGCLMDTIEAYHQFKPILGVCLGMQALVQFFGGEIRNMETVKHGKQESCCVLDQSGLFDGIPDELTVGRYHSWGALPEDLPNCLEVTAQSADGYVMALKHESLPINAVQFHPESIMTEYGKDMMRNWINSVSLKK